MSTDNYPSDALHIWAENDPVNEHNNNKLEQLNTPLFVLRASDQYPANVSKHDIDRVLLRGRSETSGLDYEIKIKEGARIMLTTNLDIADRLINGQMGTVVKIHFDRVAQKPTVVYVKFDDNIAESTSIQTSGNRFARESSAVPIKPVLSKIKVRPGKPSSPEIQRIQFPIALAWACTVHKVQGLTLQNVVISFNLKKQRSFNYGQMYVALSRSTSLQGLHILGEINNNHVKADPRVHLEYDRLRSICVKLEKEILVNEKRVVTNSVVQLCLLNIRFIRKHCCDIRDDVNLSKSDILALTETQLLPRDDDCDIRDELTPFTLYRHDHESDKFSSLAVCIKKNIRIVCQEQFPSLNALKFEFFCDNKEVKRNISFLLIYRKNCSKIQQFVNGLNYLLRAHTVDILLGDFNINYFNSKDREPLTLLMESLHYVQIVKEPTFISGSLIDHVYIRDTHQSRIHSTVVSVYCSDHDAVRITMQI